MENYVVKLLLPYLLCHPGPSVLMKNARLGRTIAECGHDHRE